MHLFTLWLERKLQKMPRTVLGCIRNLRQTARQIVYAQNRRVALTFIEVVIVDGTMSFGFSIGGIIMVANLTLTTWTKFRDTPDQFAAISSEEVLKRRFARSN